MKTMMASGISYVSVKGVMLFIVDLSTGYVLHSEHYQGSFPKETLVIINVINFEVSF
jgi:hypothetical protein